MGVSEVHAAHFSSLHSLHDTLLYIFQGKVHDVVSDKQLIVYLRHLLSDDDQPVSRESIYNETTSVVDFYLKISQKNLFGLNVAAAPWCCSSSKLKQLDLAEQADV